MATTFDSGVLAVTQLLTAVVIGFTLLACGPKVVANNPSGVVTTVTASNGVDEIDGGKHAYSRVVVVDHGGVSREYTVVYNSALYPKLSIKTSGVLVYLVTTPGGPRQSLKPGRTILSSDKPAIMAPPQSAIDPRAPVSPSR